MKLFNWLKKILSNLSAPEIWYGDHASIRIGVLTYEDKDVCFRATAKFISNRGRVDFFSGIGVDRSSAVIGLHKIVKEHKNLKWKDSDDVWYGDRASIVVKRAANEGYSAFASAKFVSDKGVEAVFGATGSSRNSAVENLHKMVNNSSILYWQD